MNGLIFASSCKELTLKPMVTTHACVSLRQSSFIPKKKHMLIVSWTGEGASLVLKLNLDACSERVAIRSN